MKHYQRGLLVGRFQPFHNGHLYLIRHALKRVNSLIIGIGSANIYDENNPLHYEERKAIIEKVIKEEKIFHLIDSIIAVNDYYDDNLWYEYIVKKIGKINVVVGNNEWTNRIFESRKHSILRVGYYKRYLYEGEKIRRLIKEKKNWQNRLPDYLRPITKKYLYHLAHLKYRFDHVGVAGTFDHFHAGHQKLIDRAFEIGKKVSIDVSTEDLYKHKLLPEVIESFAKRKKAISTYLKAKKIGRRADFFPLSDIYGRARTDGTLEALVVSRETYGNAIKVNKMREELRLPQLKIVIVPPVLGNDGQIISSNRIRKGEIDREGNNYFDIFADKKQLILPEKMRQELRKPLGKVIKGKENELKKTAKKTLQLFNQLKRPMVVAVGDIIAMSLEKIGLIPDVKIIDYRSRRQEIQPGPASKGRTPKNNPGTVTYEAVVAINYAINNYLKSHKKQTVVIKGEEDLLALPAILFTPLGSIVLYGQIDLGVIAVQVEEKKKKDILEILQKFT